MLAGSVCASIHMPQHNGTDSIKTDICCLAHSTTQMTVLECTDTLKYVCSYNRNIQRTNIKITFLHTTCHISDTIRSILIIFREILNLNKAYIKTYMDC